MRTPHVVALGELLLWVSVKEVEALMQGPGDGRMQQCRTVTLN